jgi:uncharacterized protein
VVDLVLGPADQPGSLEAYWAAELPAQLGAAHRRPTAVHERLTGSTPRMECLMSPEEAAGNAVYCQLDESIAFDLALLGSVHDAYGAAASAALIAHEWGHHVQQLTERPSFAKRAELQADCYAGMYLGWLVDSGTLEASSVLQSLSFLGDIGDDRLDPGWNVEWFDPRVHGDGHERRQAHGIGYSTGSAAYRAMSEQPPTRLDPGASREPWWQHARP